jgi:8-oxo-dGTP diphosphatase
MQLIYGTGNQAKLNAMRDILKELEIGVIGINDLDYEWPEIDESGNDPLENARIKALEYYKTCGRPVFSCDSGLYIDGLEEARQPGVHVRNINGRRLSDREMVEYYAGIAESLGGRCIAGYRNAICLVWNEDAVYEYMGEDISGEAFIFTDTPHPRQETGFPLDSLSVDIKTGRYYYDLDDTEVVSSTKEGFINFFRRTLNL